MCFITWTHIFTHTAVLLKVIQTLFGFCRTIAANPGHQMSNLQRMTSRATKSQPDRSWDFGSALSLGWALLPIAIWADGSLPYRRSALPKEMTQYLAIISEMSVWVGPIFSEVTFTGHHKDDKRGQKFNWLRAWAVHKNDCHGRFRWDWNADMLW